MKIESEEQYLARHGASRQNIGDAALHRQPGSTPNSRARASKRQNALDHALLIRRAELREQYVAAIDAGELRPPSVTEQHVETANGHPDNDAVQAARRCCARRGIDWRAS